MLLGDLKGKKALVAGSTQGIGLASAQALSDMGATCVLIARNEEGLKKAVSTLNTNFEQKHSYLVADFSKPEEVKAVVAKYAADNLIHVLVNNSGGPPAGLIVDAIEDGFYNAFQQHLICNHILATTVLEGMKEAGYGRIINIVSTSVKIPLKGLGVSNTIRGAVASWSKTLSNEVAEYGVTVNSVLPGATATGRLSAIIDNKAAKQKINTDKVEQAMLAEIPAKRFGKPEEIAATVAFLASSFAGYINGVSIPVDGGRTGCL